MTIPDITLSRRLLLLSAGAAALPALAQTGGYPTKPIRLVVPYSPGGGADGNARLIAQAMTGTLGQSVVIDNKPGASGVIGDMAVVQSPADGYTMLYDTFPYAVNAVLRKLPFDPVKDLQPVSQAVNMPNILLVPVDAPYKTFKELLAYAKANPGKLSFASYGAGGCAHLAGEMLRRDAGVDWLHVPYSGGAPAVTALLAGQVSAYFANPVSGLPYVKSGKLRALAVASKQRMATLPDVPTIIESGFPDFEIIEWNGFFAPAATPAPIVERFSNSIRDAIRQPEVHTRLVSLGIDPVGSTPKEFGTFLQGQIARWAALVKSNKITVE